MKTLIVLGSNSDIAKELSARFSADDWHALGWKRGQQLPKQRWDALICSIGVLNPIGRFFDTPWREWEESLRSNALLPLQLLRDLWWYRRVGATVIFFSGAGVSRSAQTYSAYSASKMMLFKMAELLDDEEADTKFVILGPGMVRTKIQEQTLSARGRAGNYERVAKFMKEGDEQHGAGTSHEKIYEAVKWCIEQPKEVVGGRNIYIPTDRLGEWLAERLKADPSLYKLRRFGDGTVLAKQPNHEEMIV